MRFIVDGMLGGLARWLRILGHDVVYERGSDDTSLLKTAAEQGRVLLTGDKELFERAVSRQANTLLITGLREDERIAEVARKFGIDLDPNMSSSRCPECGSQLGEVAPSRIENMVPTTTLRLYDRFWQCRNISCEKVYWMGSHWRQITKTLARTKKRVEGESTRA